MPSKKRNWPWQVTLGHVNSKFSQTQGDVSNIRNLKASVYYFINPHQQGTWEDKVH